jgi:hypothetical protein
MVAFKRLNKMFHSKAPKNYSRKGFICTCECFIIDKNNKKIDTGMIKYKVNPNKNLDLSFYKSKYKWGICL